MSLRSSRSWMPARKSWASRIIGLRLVRRDRGLHLHLDAGQRALDDLDQHRVGARARVVGEVAERELRWAPGGSSAGSLVRGDDQVAVVVDAGGEAGVQRHGRAELLDDRRARRRRARRAGPAASSTGVSTYPSSASKQTGRRAGLEASLRSRLDRRGSTSRISGRWIGPMPVTRRFTHSTCWVGRRRSRSRRAPGARRGSGRPPRRARPGRARRRAPAPAPRRPGRSSAGPRSAAKTCCSVGEPLRGQRRARLARQRVVRRAAASPGRARSCERDVGLHVVVPHVDGQQAERGDVAGVGRHQHGRAGRGCPSAGTAAASRSRRTWPA